MKNILIVVMFVVASCSPNPAPLFCTEIVEVGDCMEHWMGNLCAVKLNNGKFIRAHAPAMVGMRVCQRSNGNWFFEK